MAAYITVVLLNCAVSCKFCLVAHPTTQVSLSCRAQVYPDVHPLAADDQAEDNWDI